jgi:P27 family predicted phage terminase small subunit
MGQRPSKSSKLRSLEGGRSNSLEDPDKLLEKEPKFKPILPDAPQDIDDGAVDVYNRLKRILEDAALATEADSDALVILSQIRSRIATIHEYIKKKNESLVQQTEKPAADGGVIYELKQSPYVVMEKQYYQLFRMYAKEFGLTPVGRVGLSVNPGQKKSDDFEDLLD